MTSPDGYNTYVYDPSGKRVWASATGTLSFYDIFGKQVGSGGNVYFGNRLVSEQGGVPVVTDRLGSVRVNGGQPMSYLPYGMEQTSTPNGQVKFGTYLRDGNSSTLGADYADQRYYNPWFGRFNTPDPGGSGNPADPTSWNMYAYTGGDPINRIDPTGTDWCDIFPDSGACFGYSQPCGFGYGTACGVSDYCASFYGGNPSFGFIADPLLALTCVSSAIPVLFAPQQAAPAAPSCTLTLDVRGTDLLGGANVLGIAHGYLSETSSALPSFTLIYEGQKQNGLLKGYGGPLGSGSLDSDDPVADAVKGSTISGPQVCGWGSILQSDIVNLNGTNIVYSDFGPNSNSVLRYLLQSLPDSSWAKVPFLIGYSTSLPDLNTRTKRTPRLKEEFEP